VGKKYRKKERGKRNPEKEVQLPEREAVDGSYPKGKK